MMTTDELRRRLTEAWHMIENEKRVDEAFERYFSPGYVRHSDEGELTRDQFAQVLKAMHAGFPDVESHVAATVVENDLVSYRWVSSGTHLGTYLGVPPTRNRIDATGITISRFEDGLIVEDWASWNKVSVLHALGILPIA